MNKLKTRLFLLSLAALSGCSVYDAQQLVALPTAVPLIRQQAQHNYLSLPIAGNTLTQLNDVRINPKQLAVTPSHSLAIEANSATITPASPTASLEEARKTLIRYVAAIEQQPEQLEQVLADAERLAQRYPADALLQSFWQRLSRYSDWQPVTAIINNAGIDFVSVQGWQPESPFIRARRALLPPVAAHEQVIFADQRLVLLLTNLTAVNFAIEARLDDVPFLAEVPTQLVVQIDEQPVQKIFLADKADWRAFSLNIPAGEHALRLYQEQPVGNQYVKLRFNDEAINLAVAQERPYFISTPDTPLEFYTQGASVLRIDELTDGVTSYRYQTVPNGWQKISLPPTEGKARSLLRVSQRVVNLHPEPPRNRIIARTLQPVPAPDVLLPPFVAAKQVELIDAFELGGQEDGTWSVGMDFVRRNNKQESGTQLPEEQFMQQRINYRYYDEPHNIYWNSQGLTHVREQGNVTLGLNESVYYHPDGLPFSVRSEAKLFAQAPKSQWEWLGQWNLTLANAYKLQPKTRLIPSLNFFARTMSLRNDAVAHTDPNFRLTVDQDVFTPYKADHSTGFTPALTVEHNPWLDTVWSAKASAGSNEDWDFTHPDHYSTEAHWQQLLGSVSLDASYRIAFYQVDADRAVASQRSYAGLELNWQHWTAYQNRFEIGAQYSYDMQRHSHLATLSFTYHFGEGRGYRDFIPSDIDFRSIRQRQITDEKNNLMRDVWQ